MQPTPSASPAPAASQQSPPAGGNVSVIWKGPEDQKLGEESKDYSW